MLDLNDTLKSVYNAHRAIIMPGSGTYGMEAVARQFATNDHVVVLRNGFFSFRWTDLFETCGINANNTVINADTSNEAAPQVSPKALNDVI
jgi:aspartate aminotransferase-like enzyme